MEQRAVLICNSLGFTYHILPLGPEGSQAPGDTEYSNKVCAVKCLQALLVQLQQKWVRLDYIDIFGAGFLHTTLGRCILKEG